MVELHLRVLDGLKIPAEWALSIVVPILLGRVISGTAFATEL